MSFNLKKNKFIENKVLLLRISNERRDFLDYVGQFGDNHHYQQPKHFYSNVTQTKLHSKQNKGQMGMKQFQQSSR